PAVVRRSAVPVRRGEARAQDRHGRFRMPADSLPLARCHETGTPTAPRRALGSNAEVGENVEELIDAVPARVSRGDRLETLLRDACSQLAVAEERAHALPHLVAVFRNEVGESRPE